MDTINKGFRPLWRTVIGPFFFSASMLSLAACDREPEGQVVAVVNGDEVTVQELNGELAGVGATDGEDQGTRNAALDRVVERRLLADVARDQDIESSPEYILRAKKLQETLLVQMLNEKLAREVKDPSPQDVDRMISENPQAFRDRTLFALDQVVFQDPEREDVMASLGPTKTMDEVVAVLNRAGVKFQRGNATVDSATLPANMFAQFRQIGTSEPMIIPAGNRITVAKIIATRPMPLTGNAARPVASTGFTRRETQKRLRELLTAARQEAEIKYQSGYSKPEGAASANSLPAPAPAASPSRAPAEAAMSANAPEP